MYAMIALLLFYWPASGHWERTPHHHDGYWREYTAENMAEKTGLKSWRQYPFSRYVWEWPGYKAGEKTWMSEGPPGKAPDKPSRFKWVPGHDPFAPGQKFNL